MNARHLNRDPSDIIQFLNNHREWLIKHDLRVGQFLQNVADFLGYDDPFYLENDQLLHGMREFISSLNQRGSTGK